MKDCWDKVCFFTQKDDNLTKAHVRYLEYRMIEIAKKSNRTPLKNNNQGYKNSLPESDRSDMEYFVKQVQLLLPVLGINLLQPQPTISDKQASRDTYDSPLFVLEGTNYNAKAKVIDGEFVILKGSLARKKTVDSFRSTQIAKRSQLPKANIIQEYDKDSYSFMQNYSFSSPSGASDMITGNSTNGRIMWKISNTGQTYSDWDNARLESETKTK